MSDAEPIPDYIVRLDADRRREIDAVKDRMEDFLKTQFELKHSMEIVAKGQDALKERFEVGTAKTLKELKESFDAFRVDWGEKKADDKARDLAIAAVNQLALRAEKRADESTDNFRKYLLWPVITLCITIAGAVLIFLAKHAF